MESKMAGGEARALNVAGALQSARDSRVSHARTATHPTFPACLDPSSYRPHTTA
jgi:hypothetical protein